MYLLNKKNVSLQKEHTLCKPTIMLRHKYIILFIMLAVMEFAHDAAAQRIISMHIDSTHCIGDSLWFSVGYYSEGNVVVAPPLCSNSHPQRTLLPDGKICDSVAGTCTYRSPITFSGFGSHTTITSAQNINFVRINIEHSWMGDIFVALECPSGQYASLMNAITNNSSEICGESKFDSLIGWDYTYTNLPPSTFLGLPIDVSSRISPCDTNIADNAPGVGWNYCWSENNSHQYAAQDGLIYRTENRFYDSQNYITTIDSTHITDNTHFYRPQQSFDSLIGCPVNGSWNIVVQDSWGNDNGWLFDWELAFDEHLAQPTLIDYVMVTWGDTGWVTMSPGGTYYQVPIDPPEFDTTIEYSLMIGFYGGDTLDTTFFVHWIEPFIYSETDTLCQGDTARWSILFFTTDTLVHIQDTAFTGCDSIVDLSYTFMPSYDLHDTLPYCANEQFLYEGVDYGGPCTIIIPHQTRYGCDSTVTVHLVTIDSMFHLQLQMSEDGVVWSTDTVLHGCRPMTVWLRDTTLFEQWRRWTFGDGDTLLQQVTAYQQPQPLMHTYDSVGSYALTLTAESIHGCVDSAVFHLDAVNVHDIPTAEFTWSPKEIVMLNPHTQFLNLSSPIDSLLFLWHIPNGEAGEDTTTVTMPSYRWTDGSYGGMDVALEAIWAHDIGNSMTLKCIDTTVHTVFILNEYLQFPNLVSPNGDGINDRWEIANLLQSDSTTAEGLTPVTLYPMNELWIFDRWGLLIYHKRNIRQTEDFWDPTPYPDGTYYFRFCAQSRYGLVRRNGVIEVSR